MLIQPVEGYFIFMYGLFYFFIFVCAMLICVYECVYDVYMNVCICVCAGSGVYVCARRGPRLMFGNGV